MMALILLAVLIVTDGVARTDAQFEKQPDAGIMLVPVNDQVTFSCSVEEGYFVDWQVRINNGAQLGAARRINEAIFTRHNFTFTGVGTRSSTVSFNVLDETGDRMNNVTSIICVAQLGISARVLGNEVQVIFYGAPPPPTDLSVTEDELGSLNISWSLEFIGGVPVNYTLTVLNLNTTSAQPIIIAGLLDQHYVFETSRPCDVYSFTVAAVTAAGNSTPSQALLWNGTIDMCLNITPRMTSATTIDDNQGKSSVAKIVIIVVVIIIVSVAGIIIVIIIAIAVNKAGRKTKPEELVTADVKCLDAAIKCGQEIKVPLTIKCSSDLIQCLLQLSRNRSTINKLKVMKSPQETYIAVTPHEQGRHMLIIKAKGQHIKGSPFHFEVEIPIKHFPLNNPCGLATSLKEVLVVEEKKGGIKVFRDCNPSRFMHVGEKNLTGITVHAERGLIFVTTGQTGKVIKLNSEGKQIDSNGSLMLANGLCINKNDDELYVCDTKACQIKVFNLNLQHVSTITGKENGCSPFQEPRDVDFDKNNNIYVAEKTGIRVLSPEGVFKIKIGEGKLNNARALKVVDSSIFVASKDRVSLFHTDGTHVRDIHKSGVSDAPMGITVDRDGYLYVSTAGGKMLLL